jgi:PBP1b-binding outer membrane lipoprotein LpoB
MSLFDFAKDVGRQIFDTDAEAADSIKEHLEIKLSGIKNITVDFDDGVATICGECINEATRNNAILIAGDVKGVKKVVAGGLKFAQPKPEEPKESVEYYTIVSGDTLGKIAKHFYGNASKYTRIHEANKELIPDPNKIYPGQKIKIPRD